jgi:hypothetical protein
MNFGIKHCIFEESNNFNIIKNICTLCSGIILDCKFTFQSDKRDVVDFVNFDDFDDFDTCNVLMFYVNIFESIGLPPRFSHNAVNKKYENKKTFFSFEPNQTRPEFISPETVAVVLDNTKIVCDSETATGFFSIQIHSELPDIVISVLNIFCRHLIFAIQKHCLR